MRTKNSLGNRLVALALSIVMVLGMLPLNAAAEEATAVAQIGDTTYDSLAEAMAAVPRGTNQVAPAEKTTIKLLRDTAYAFDVGDSTGSSTMNLKLDLNGNTLTLAPSVGSAGTKSSGIRVLAYSKLEIANGQIVCSSEAVDNVKVGIANYGTLTLTDVAVKRGALTTYTINNRGALTLNGETTIESGSTCAITNDPYNLYYTTNVNASVTCNSSKVVVESMLLERYARNSNNKGGVELNISAGYFGKIVEDGNTAVPATYNVTGGTIGVSTAAELEQAVHMIKAGKEYTCPQQPVTIKLRNSISGSFDVGTSNGKAPKNILLDLNGYTLTLAPGVGSTGTKTSGIRVLAYSKLEVKNGTIVCSSAEADKVKVGIANYSQLILDGVAVKAGALTTYTINNRGALTLKGKTSVNSGSVCAITNDPYDLYYTTNVDASVTCNSSNVSVDSILVERYERESANKGGVKLNISAGYIGTIKEDNNTSVNATYNITGGSFGSDVSDFCADNYQAVKDENNNYVVKSKQADFGFKQDQYTVTFGENGNKFTAPAQNAAGEITYSFVTATDVAEINAKTGELTILKAGTVQVKAVAAGNAQYVAAEDTYTLVIEPAYGDVHSLSGGKVEGSETNNIVVSIDQAILEWVEKNESMGWTKDGWWAGIKVTAPDGVDLSKAIYQCGINGTFDGAVAMPFTPDDGRYMRIWNFVTVEMLKSFSASGKNIDYVWRFSWDGDDVYEQTVTMTLDPNGITLKQTGFAFGIQEDTVTYGESYTAKIPSGGQGNKITYSIENVSESATAIAEIDPETGVLTINRAGTVKITATLSGEYYEDISAHYILTIDKADQPDFDFVNSSKTVTWQKNALDALAVKNGLGSGALVWSIKGNSDVATVDPVSGKITLLKAGTFTLQVQKLGDDCYNASAVKEIEIEVLRRNQTGFGFANESVTVTYNDNENVYTQAATGGQSEKSVVYELVSGDAATVNEKTGKVTVLRSGTVVIRATKPSDDRYKAIAKEYTLVIEKDEQSFTFVHADAITEKYGLTSFATQIVPSALNSGAVTYAVSENAIGATVNEDGLVSFGNSTGKVGTVTVTVTMVEDEYYKPYTATYTITLGYEVAPAKPYTLSDNTVNGWFIGDIIITAPTGYLISYTNDLVGTEWKDSVAWTKDGKGDEWEGGSAPAVYLKHKETGAITDQISVSDVKRDTVKPNGLKVYYEVSVVENIGEKLFGFSAGSVKVTAEANDATSGIAKMEYKIGEGGEYKEIVPNEGKYEFLVTPQDRGQIWLRVTDIAGNSEDYAHVNTNNQPIVLVVDDTAPGLNVYYSSNEGDIATDNIRYVKNGKVEVTFEINDENFDLRAADPVVKVNGKLKDDWTFNKISGKLTFVLEEEGDYKLEASFIDRLDRDVTYTYEVRIDKTAPIIESSIKDGTYFAEGQSLLLTITEHNFDAAKVMFSIAAVDSANNSVLTEEEINEFVNAAKNWTRTGDTDTYTLELPITKDGNYTVNIKCTDNLEQFKEKNVAFTVDTQIPTDLNVAYRAKSATTNVLQEVLEAITFGNHEEKYEVVLAMNDATAGIDYIELTITPEGPASATDLVMPTNLKINADGTVKSGDKGFIGEIRSTQENGNLILSFDIPAQFRGKVSFVAYDKSGNFNDSHNDPGTLVVDTMAPGHTITYNASNVVVVDGMTDLSLSEGGFVDASDTEASYVMYFSGDAVATIEIAEANFDPADVQIVVLDADGNEYHNWKQSVWTTTVKEGEQDVHTTTVKIMEEGDYQIQVIYQDRSLNTAVNYLSSWIVVDKTAPEIEVEYDNTDVKNTIADRDYFAAAQSATITIKEHNFRADDVVITVYAENVPEGSSFELLEGGIVKVYKEQGEKRENWTAYESGTWRVENDTYKITLNFDADANYTFDIQYKDLAKNEAEGYKKLFTVDTAAPNTDDLQIVIGDGSNNGTHYYDKDTVEVTLKATDATAGIKYFTYQYILNENVSGVNAGMEKAETLEAKYENGVAMATFYIPKEALNDKNQFNGTITVSAHDRSENSVLVKDGRIVVVDSIAPKAKITYNAPVRKANGISYYDGSIYATIEITEANFDAKDVVVTVTKNGTQVPVKVSWKDNSLDIHTGTFTLSNDGDYIVSVRYTDKSGNKMVSYTSNRLTVDTVRPTIKVSNIKDNSANKDEKYGFVITVNDINLDASSLKPVLQAVVRDEQGNYKTVNIDLGNATTVVKGKTYTYTVENLPQDGLYTLTVRAKDMSANTISQIILDDSKRYDEVQFSINRDGSTFGYGNKFTEDLVNKYYVYSVDEDVVVAEVNVDPVETYKVTLNGRDLVEGVDYTTTQTSRSGEWSERTYSLKKALFNAEGEYKIIISSTDKTETTAFSDIKNLSLAFVVDQAKPVLTITGLEGNGRYQTDEQTVTLIPTDEGGRLNNLTVLVLDSDGDPLKNKETGEDISVRFKMSGEELLKYLEENDGMVTFTIPEGLNNQVRIICNDCAVNAEGKTNEYNELFTRVTVSQNSFVIFYANTPLFVGTIVGILAVAGLIVFLIMRKGGKNKKEAKKA